jgi:uncharacterized protein with GYD domain
MDKAYILISCDVGTEYELVSDLKKIDHIKDAVVTYGDYDIVAEIETDSENQMNNVVLFAIRKFQKIRSTITLRVNA